MWFNALRWSHHERDGVSNHRRLDSLLISLFRCRSKKISKLRVTGLCEGNSPMTTEFRAQRASNAENVSIWWRHHEWWNPMLNQLNCDVVYQHAIRLLANFVLGFVSWTIFARNSNLIYISCFFPQFCWDRYKILHMALQLHCRGMYKSL